MEAKTKVASKKPKQKKTRLPKVQAKDIIAYYDKLDPEAKLKVRQELLKRASKDEEDRIIKKALEHPPTPPAAIKKVESFERFEPFSQQIIEYLKDVRVALADYLPLDEYEPGDENRLDLIRKETLRAIEPIEWLLKSYFRYEVKGIENIPKEGRAMVISNHGLLPVDGWFLFYEIMRATGRWPRGLTDWRIFKFPYLRQFFMDMGMLVGSHKNGDNLLSNEEMIFIMPGGSKEAWKSSQFRYRLLWKGRYGFIRLALRNRCPIIPSANVGTDDTYNVYFNGYIDSYRFFRTRKALLPLSLPVGIGVLPFPVKMTQYVGEPVVLPYPPEAENDPGIVEECQTLIKGKVYDLIDQGLQERAQEN